MLKTHLAFAAALLAATSAVAAERSWMVENFESIEVAGPHDVTVVTGGAQRVVATGDQDAIDNLEVDVSGRTLKIRPKKSRMWGNSDALQISVSVPRLESARVSGSGDFAVDRMRGNEVSVRLAGSGDAQIGAVEAEAVDLSISGSGDLSARGKCQTAKLSVAGSGDMNAGALSCRELKASIAGSGNISAHASGSAEARIAGSGDMNIAGGAKCSTRVAGSGSVNCG